VSDLQVKKIMMGWEGGGGVMVFMAISVQRGRASFNVNSHTSPQPPPTLLPPLTVLSCLSAYQDPGRHSDQGCLALPVCLFAPYPTLWHGMRHIAPRAPSAYPAWRREIKQTKNCHEDCSHRRGSHHWRNLSALP